MKLPEFNPCPQAGTGVHVWIIESAWKCRFAGAPPEDAVREIEACMTRRPSPANEIESAVAKVYGATVTTISRPRESKWPARDPQAIDRIASGGPGIVDLMGLSPVQVGAGQHTAALVDYLFPGDPLLCVATANHNAITAPLSSLRETLAKRQFIVPSPMRAHFGKNQQGKDSSRCLDNTGPRKYLVIESDQGTGDQHAAVLWHLAQRAPLALVLSSGGKSLHGWFKCGSESERTLRNFMRYAVTLGADPATWTKCQLVRMPDGMRDNGKIQKTFYFNPEIL